MLTLTDCIAFSGLSPEQLDAVAAHQHLAPVIAAEWAESVLDSVGGETRVEALLIEELAMARRRGDSAGARRLNLALAEFVRDHPHPRGK